MLNLHVETDTDTLLACCARRGLAIKRVGMLKTRPDSRHWHLTLRGRPGTIEVTDAGGGVALKVAANRDAGWAMALAKRLDRELTEAAASARGEVLPVRPRVLLVTHNPPAASEGGRRLSECFGWHDPDALAQQCIADIEAASHGYLRYEIVERIAADWFPVKKDGFRYSAESYERAWRTRAFHQPDAIDYEAQVQRFDLIGRYERGEIDEAWFMAFPYSGDWESTMVGSGAFWCNSPPVPNTGRCAGRFVIMAFNYERDVGCMLENFGHRVESIMERVYRRHAPDRNLWHRFIRYDKVAPDQSHCGNVHFAPNSARDYDWGSPRPVTSYCDDWLSFPHLPGIPRTVDCREWGGGHMRAHHVWWLGHLPHVAGDTDGVQNNWWGYVVDPNRVA